MKEYAKQFYKSKEWRKCRAAFFTYRHGLCERCNGPGKIVHHKVYITPDNIQDPDVTLSFRNLELLCATCHQHEHFVKYSPVVEGLRFDENGDLVRCNLYE